MKNTIRNIFLIIILILLIGLSIIAIYLGKIRKDKYIFTTYYLSEKADDKKFQNVNYEPYLNMKAEETLSMDYTYYDHQKSIEGKIYIDDNKKLHITDVNEDRDRQISDISFKTMYSKNYDPDYAIYAYLISEEGKVYFFELKTNDINQAKISPLIFNKKAVDFIDVDFNLDKYYSYRNIFVLTDDNEIYDVVSGIKYSEDIISLYNYLFVFNDKTISNTYGYMITGENKQEYKIKYIFETYDDNDFTGENTLILITEDNKLLYYNVSKLWEIVEFNKKVDKIDIDVKYPYIKGDLRIIFDNDSEINLKASCNQYFCPNKLT